jgi:hypothetical protein
MSRAAPLLDAAAMTMKPNMTQRDLVRLALLTCGDAPAPKKPR